MLGRLHRHHASSQLAAPPGLGETLATLGERAVAWSEAELARGAGEEPRGSNTGPDVIAYFSGARRRGTDALLGLKEGNWCAAGASAALYAVLQDGETPPHGWRAAVVELVDDAKDRGAWAPIEDVRSGAVPPPSVGDLVIYDRSDPANPDSAWWRHVNRVRTWAGDGTFSTIGANEGDAWGVGQHTLDEPRILGFVRYPKTLGPLVFGELPQPPGVTGEDEGGWGWVLVAFAGFAVYLWRRRH